MVFSHASHVGSFLRNRNSAGTGPVIEGLESRKLLSSNWFVSTAGSDQNPGTLAAPFKTIQRAANIAEPGDVVQIEAGVYHETVAPLNSGTAAKPITFEAYNNEPVTVSGADPITGWSSAGGKIFSAPMSWDLGEGNNEVFVDGRAINEARFPNTSLDPSHPTFANASKVVVSGNVATLYDPALAQPQNYWRGALIHIAPGQQWVAQTGNIISSAPGQITFTYTYNDKYEVPAAGNPYYITGTLKALDSAGEWYRDPTTGKLDLRTPADDSPSNHDIEAKQRDYAFDLNNRSYITISGITIFSATVLTGTGSVGVVLNHISALYTSQFNARSWTAPANGGIVLNGPGDVLENSVIAFSAGDGVFVNGAGDRVVNNYIHDVDTGGGDSAAIRIYANSVQVLHNTIYNCGRDGIMHAARGLTISYNTIHDVGLQTTEAGGIYCVNTNGGGTVISYNTIYNMHSGGFGQTALFLDNYSSGYVVDHNIASNVDIALKLNYTARDNDIYNNTLSGSREAVFSNYAGDWDGTRLTNNVFLGSARLGSGAYAAGNVTSASVTEAGAGVVASGCDGNVGAQSGGGSGSGGGSSGNGGSGTGGSGNAGTGGNSSGGGSTSTGSGNNGGGTGGGTTSSPPTVGKPPTTPSSPSKPTSNPPPTSTPSTPTTSQPPTTPSTPSGPATSPSPTSTPPTGSASAPTSDPSAPGTPPTAADLIVTCAADRAAITDAVQQRRGTLKQLAGTCRSDIAQWRAAKRALAIQERLARTQGNSQSVALAAAQSQVTALVAVCQQDKQTLAVDRKTDFSGIDAARAQLKSDRQSLRAARRSKN